MRRNVLPWQVSWKKTTVEIWCDLEPVSYCSVGIASEVWMEEDLHSYSFHPCKSLPSLYREKLKLRWIVLACSLEDITFWIMSIFFSYRPFPHNRSLKTWGLVKTFSLMWWELGHGLKSDWWPPSKMLMKRTLTLSGLHTLPRQTLPTMTQPRSNFRAYGLLQGQLMYLITLCTFMISVPKSIMIGASESTSGICPAIPFRCGWWRATYGVGLRAIIWGIVTLY